MLHRRNLVHQKLKLSVQCLMSQTDSQNFSRLDVDGTLSLRQKLRRIIATPLPRTQDNQGEEEMHRRKNIARATIIFSLS